MLTEKISMVIRHIQNHIERHKKLHACILILAIIGAGVYFAVSKYAAFAAGETVPAAPMMDATSASDSSVTVGWRYGANGGSNIIQAIVQEAIGESTDWNEVARIDEDPSPRAPIEKNTTIITGLTNGTTYRFRVIAVNAIGQSDPSDESGDLIPAIVNPITALTLVPGSGGTLLVSWSPSVSGTFPIATYDISLRSDGKDIMPQTASETSSPHTFSGMVVGATYHIGIIAIDTHNNRSSEVSLDVTIPGGGDGDDHHGDDHGGGGGENIQSVSANESANSTTITWTTVTASGTYLAYGLDPNWLVYSSSDDTAQTDHSVTVDTSGVPACTVLFYKVYDDKTVFDARLAVDYSSAGLSKVLVGTCRASLVDVTTKRLESSTQSSVYYGDPSMRDRNLYFEVSTPTDYSNRAGDGAVFQLKQLQRTTFFDTTSKPASAVAVSEVVDAKAYPDKTDTIAQFDKGLDITMSYDSDLLGDTSPDDLAIWRFDDSTWTKLSECSVDTELTSVTCTTTHFSAFAVFAGGGDDASGDEQNDTSSNLTGSIPKPGVVSGMLDYYARIFGTETLYRGHQGHTRVALLQTLLAQIDPGFATTIDGIFGPKTFQALFNFQKTYSLKQDGIFGPQSRSKILELVQ